MDTRLIPHQTLVGISGVSMGVLICPLICPSFVLQKRFHKKSVSPKRSTKECRNHVSCHRNLEHNRRLERGRLAWIRFRTIVNSSIAA